MSLVDGVQLMCRAVLVGPLLRMIGRPRIVGRQHVPSSGGVILAANHLAAVDSLYLALAARRTVHFLAKAEYFDGRGVRGRASRWFVVATGQIPVDRRGGEHARPAVEAAVDVLARGGAWGIHPEGTRSPDGAMYRGRTGAVRVALATGVPLLPVAITGTDHPPRPWGARVTVTVLPPLDLSGVVGDAAGVRAATDALMGLIAEYSGQRRVDDYARRWHGEAPIRDDTAA